jgi:hypothetical protein
MMTTGFPGPAGIVGTCLLGELDIVGLKDGAALTVGGTDRDGVVLGDAESVVLGTEEDAREGFVLGDDDDMA